RSERGNYRDVIVLIRGDEDGFAAGAQHPRKLAKHLRRLIEVFHDAAGYHEIEIIRGKRQLADVTADAERSRRIIRFQHGIEVDANHERERRQVLAEVQVAPAPRIQNPLPRNEIFADLVPIKGIVELAAAIVFFVNSLAFFAVFGGEHQSFPGIWTL